MTEYHSHDNYCEDNRDLTGWCGCKDRADLREAERAQTTIARINQILSAKRGNE